MSEQFYILFRIFSGSPLSSGQSGELKIFSFVAPYNVYISNNIGIM